MLQKLSLPGLLILRTLPRPTGAISTAFSTLTQRAVLSRLKVFATCCNNLQLFQIAKAP
jgi:hypothetical protein